MTSPRPAASSPDSPPARRASPAVARWRLAPLLLGACLSLAGIGIYMWPRIQVVRLAYRVQSAEQRLKDLLKERDHLQLELATLKDPQRIFRLATEQLGMITPRHDQRFMLTRESKD
jgi:cell division protein FtsL